MYLYFELLIISVLDFPNPANANLYCEAPEQSAP